MEQNVKCPACTSTVKAYQTNQFYFEFFDCPVCGRSELKNPVEDCAINRNHMAAYLVYHCYKDDYTKSKFEYRYHTVRDKEWCDKYRKEVKDGKNIEGQPVHMDETIVENWYPKTFSERVDNILLYIANHTQHIGQPLQLSANQLLNVLFVDKQMLDENISSPAKGKWIERTPDEFIPEANYMLRFLKEICRS